MKNSNFTIKKLSLSPSSIDIEWNDSKKSYFHFLWLRDNCPSNEHPDARHRMFNLLDVSEDIYPKKYFLNKKVTFDLTLLGIGQDGHIASLFKNNINKKSRNDVGFVKMENFSRITLTLKCLNNSKSIFLWAPGKEKSNIVKKILSDQKFKYPASFLKEKNNFLFYSN